MDGWGGPRGGGGGGGGEGPPSLLGGDPLLVHGEVGEHFVFFSGCWPVGPLSRTAHMYRACI